MPQEKGINICHRLCLKYPRSKIILLSSYEDKTYIQQGILSGAKGYINKGTTSEELSRTIELVDMGYSVFESKMLKKLIIKNPKTYSGNRGQTGFNRLEKSQGRTTQAVKLRKPVINSSSQEILANQAKLKELDYRHQKQLLSKTKLNNILILNLFLAAIMFLVVVLLL